MGRQDILTILITFSVGMAIGFYAYFAGYSPVASTVEEQIDTFTVDIVIVGEAYGGCERSGACPSFRIAEDGSYRYFYLPRGASQQVLRTGTIPADRLRALHAQLTVEAVESASRPIEPALCDSYTDGIDVRYEVMLDRESYVIDSCGSAVDGDGSLWQSLSSVWDFFEEAG